MKTIYIKITNYAQDSFSHDTADSSKFCYIAIMKRVSHNIHYLTYLTPDMKNKLITAAITIYTLYSIMSYMCDHLN